MKTLFVKNLPADTKDADLIELFSQFGKVRGAKLSTDVFSGNCRGFATVDMEGHEARAAIAGLNGKSFKGNSLKVSDDQPGGRRGGRR